MVSGHANKEGEWFFKRFENKLKEVVVPRLPLWLGTQQLTYMTILWCIVIIGFSYLAQFNVHYLWVVSLAIGLQWLTDLLDGAVGRYRNEGLVKWGFYMDHFLDYVFLASIVVGYFFFTEPQYYIHLLFLLAIFAGYMVNSFLYFGATHNFKISQHGIGPTEIRILFIVVNVLNIFVDRIFLAWTIPWILGLGVLGLAYQVYKDQKEIYALDMKAMKK